MMRRIVDASVPFGLLIALAPPSILGRPLPASLTLALGDSYGHAWSLAIWIAMLAIILGIILRKPKPAWSYILEWPALIFAGLLTTIYGTAIALNTGTQSWVGIWFVYAIALHFLARFAEMAYARAVVAKRQQ
jgi:hypothetical protein